MDGPLRPGELEKEIGWAPQSSLRAVVTKMREVGALCRLAPEDGSPNAATELTAAGRELVPVANALEHWLQSCPDGPLPLEDVAAHGIVKVLTAGWDSTVIRALAERPQTLIELSAGIVDLNYPALKRRLTKLRSTHLVAPVRSGNATAYTATEWLRHAVVPLTLAGRWERRHDTGAQPISQMEVEAAFLLALPLISLPPRSSGSCALAVLVAEDRPRSRRSVAGVTLEAKQGELLAYEAGAGPAQDTWVLGTIDAWLDAMIDGDNDRLRFRGAKPRLAENVVKALHSALFSAPPDPRTATAAQGRGASGD
jgi:DNA-binding HxlR family transcriptional regulator